MEGLGDNQTFSFLQYKDEQIWHHGMMIWYDDMMWLWPWIWIWIWIRLWLCYDYDGKHVYIDTYIYMIIWLRIFILWIYEYEYDYCQYYIYIHSIVFSMIVVFVKSWLCFLMQRMPHALEPEWHPWCIDAQSHWLRPKVAQTSARTSDTSRSSTHPVGAGMRLDRQVSRPFISNTCHVFSVSWTP